MPSQTSSIFVWLKTHWIISSLIVVTILVVAITVLLVIHPAAAASSSTTPTITPSPTTTPTVTDLHIGTYNILNSFVCQNTSYSWTNREPHVVTNITSGSLDAFGVQEATSTAYTNIFNSLAPDYDFIPGLARAPTQDEHVPIFYKLARLTLLSSDQKLFSQAGCSGQSDENNPRAFTVGKFALISDPTTTFTLIATHFPRKECSALQQADADELIAYVNNNVTGNYFIVADWNNGGSFVANDYIDTQLGLSTPSSTPTKYSLDKSACTFNSLTPSGTLDRILYSSGIISNGNATVSPGDINGVPCSDHAMSYGSFSV